MKARLTISLAIFASLLLASSLVLADEPKSRPDGSTDLKAKVAKLIKQLDDNDSTKRVRRSKPPTLKETFSPGSARSKIKQFRSAKLSRN